MPLQVEGVPLGVSITPSSLTLGVGEPNGKVNEARTEEERSQEANASDSRESPFQGSQGEMRIDTPSFSINSMQN
jgi:hypothetical protein